MRSFIQTYIDDHGLWGFISDMLGIVAIAAGTYLMLLIGYVFGG